MADVAVLVEGLRKRFNTREGDVDALAGVSFQVDAGECLALLGPSGSGKTTLLRCIAGLEKPDEGRIEVAGMVVYSKAERVWVPPHRRNTGMVFQSYALWPHLKVASNVAYPLVARSKLSKKERATRVQDALERVGCAHLANRFPAQLSGGQQQRVAVARAIVGDAPVVLFDEPLSSVDLRVREELRLDLLNLQRDVGFTSVYVTHDQGEATVLGDKLAVVNGGRIEQLGSPEDVYNNPATPFVSRFAGSSNWLSVESIEAGSCHQQALTEIGPVCLNCEPGANAAGSVLAIRPEYLSLSYDRTDGGCNEWQGEVVNRLFLGSYLEYGVVVQGHRLSVRAGADEGYQVGHAVWVRFAPSAVRLLRGDV